MQKVKHKAQLKFSTLNSQAYKQIYTDKKPEKHFKTQKQKPTNSQTPHPFSSPNPTNNQCPLFQTTQKPKPRTQIPPFLLSHSNFLSFLFWISKKTFVIKQIADL
jgi:hypothetical protein